MEGSPRLRVLVVEDDPLAAEALAGLLGGEGYDVQVAPTGRRPWPRPGPPRRTWP